MERQMIPQPYCYPAGVHVRRHGPDGWKDYAKYRPWLRDEFAFRCVYCLEREVWHDTRQAMHIDHCQPQALRKDLGCKYSNLLYLCPACNMLKSDTLLPDPCQVALNEYLQVYEDGSIEAKCREGEILIQILALDEQPATDQRRRIIDTLRSLSEDNWELFVRWMGYPQELPNLDDHRPPKNEKPESVQQSYYQRRVSGRLPEVY
jgi:hypothetical protein